MTVDHIRRAMRVFEAVCDLPPDARRARLDELCAEDATLRAQVERMLAADAATSAVVHEEIASEAVHALARKVVEPSSEGCPERVGGYRVVQVLGRGGMGVVYEAEQAEPRRRVALKMIRPDLATPSMMRRFRYEAQALAHLDHPGIAHVYETGTATIRGVAQAFFAMEFIEGATLDRHVANASSGVREKLELVARVCDAVQHAHQKGVIHRDLKPANILVKRSATSYSSSGGESRTFEDALGQPKILDFGVARVLDPTVQDVTRQTQTGQILGTLGYMSPEQVRGDADIDARTDVYSLGVILYELLAGDRPYDLTGKAVVEAVRIVCDEEPRSLATAEPSLRGDIATIVGKAIEKDRTRRYGSPAELAADLRRYLRDEPISARPTSALYQLIKFSRRNRSLVAGIVATFVVLVIGTVVSTWGWVSAKQAQVAESKAKTALQEEAADLQELVRFQNDLLQTLNASELGVKLREATIDAAELVVGTNAEGNLLEEVALTLRKADFATVANQAVVADIIAKARRRIEEQYHERPRVRALLLRSLYPFLPADNDAVAVELARELAALEIENHGPTDRASLSARGILCDALALAGENDEALAEASALYDDYLEHLGPADRDFLNFLLTYGQVLHQAQQFAKVKAVYLRCIEAHDRGLPIDRDKIVEARRRLSWIVISDNGWSEAMPFLKDSLAAARSDGVVDEFDAYARSFLAEAYLELGRPEEARAIAVEGFELRSGELSDANFGTYVIHKRLSWALGDCGRVGEMETCLREGLALSRLLYGELSFQALDAYLALGRWLVLRGRYDEAQGVLVRALEVGGALPQPNVSRECPALLALCRGTAAAYLLEVTAPDTLEGAERRHARVEGLRKYHQVPEALVYLLLTYASFRAHFGDDDSRTLECREELRSALEEAGLDNEAAALSSSTRG